MKTEEKHLYNLNELSDYKVASDDPDVRGWDVRDADNRVVGKVENLLVNKEMKRVVYLDVHVDKTIIDAKHDPYGRPNNVDIREFVNKDGENHVIVPIGMVNLDTKNNTVITNGIDHRTFAETKRYQQGQSLNREYESVILKSFNRNIPQDHVYEDGKFYERDEFDRARYNRRD
ncbi:PRC-barrel domain-containing protein [Aequorivita echinoideorum]|uniref:PRC-barrel domain-containing protein n=1 Tax=Aequorivita echinoideorum TaxID=1549647 RepID=A0ABS5S6M5_9FLAO|nr:PRC-barrel domain-containing protein [Aequorivita echinoideorum]MBT0608867.1 PRC-barrel domain-containing protein [Aequorivita echinoideorum]